jgi:thiamine pyrophosphokinase
MNGQQKVYKKIKELRTWSSNPRGIKKKTMTGKKQTTITLEDGCEIEAPSGNKYTLVITGESSFELKSKPRKFKIIEVFESS